MPGPVQPDLEWLKSQYGNLLFEVAQIRGVALAAQTDLAQVQKDFAALSAENERLKAENEKLLTHDAAANGSGQSPPENPQPGRRGSRAAHS